MIIRRVILLKILLSWVKICRVVLMGKVLITKEVVWNNLGFPVLSLKNRATNIKYKTINRCRVISKNTVATCKCKFRNNSQDPVRVSDNKKIKRSQLRIQTEEVISFKAKIRMKTNSNLWLLRFKRAMMLGKSMFLRRSQV